MLKEQVGLRVRKLRIAQGLTQEALGAAVHKSTQSIGGIERGAISPSLDTLEAICRKLKVSPTEIMPAKLSARASLHDEALAGLLAAAADLSLDDVQLLEMVAEAMRRRRKS